MAEEATKEEPGAPPVARIINPQGRSKSVPLQFPVEFDGKVWDAIEVRRCTGAEIKAYFERMGEGGAFALPPVVQCPMEVWDALDADDQFVVDEAAQAFMPRRLKAAVELLSAVGEKSSAK